MNAYFRNTPDGFNYDNAQPGAGDLYDLRVATRDQFISVNDDIGDLRMRIDALCDIEDSRLTVDVDAIRERESALKRYIDTLFRRVNTMSSRIEALEAVRPQPVPVDRDALIKMSMALEVCSDKSLARQNTIDVLVEALKEYANIDNWLAGPKPSFRMFHYIDPWETAIDALREAGIK